MLYWAAVFFIIAVVAAFFGFGGVAVAAAGLAQNPVFFFPVAFVGALVTRLGPRSPPRLRGALLSWRPGARGRRGARPVPPARATAVGR